MLIYRNGHGEPLVLIHDRQPLADLGAGARPTGFGASAMPPLGTPPGPESLTLVHAFLDETA